MQIMAEWLSLLLKAAPVPMAELGFNNIVTGLLICLLIIPVFIFRHYVQDHGVFPTSTAEASDGDEERTRHGLNGTDCVLAR